MDGFPFGQLRCRGRFPLLETSKEWASCGCSVATTSHQSRGQVRGVRQGGDNIASMMGVPSFGPGVVSSLEQDLYVSTRSFRCVQIT
jgi:hypothetical protein